MYLEKRFGCKVFYFKAFPYHKRIQWDSMYLLKLSLFKLLPKRNNLTTDPDFPIQIICAMNIFSYLDQ